MGMSQKQSKALKNSEEVTITANRVVEKALKLPPRQFNKKVSLNQLRPIYPRRRSCPDVTAVLTLSIEIGRQLKRKRIDRLLLVGTTAINPVRSIGSTDIEGT